MDEATTTKATLCWYLAIMTAIAVVAAVMLGTAEDASIGGALIGMVVLAGGLPWSAVSLYAIDTESSVLGMVAAWLCAVLNAFLVYALVRRKERHARRR